MPIDDKNFTKFLNRHEIDAAVQSIANRINDDYKNKEVILIGVLKGSVIFVADLARHLKIDFMVDFVRMANTGRDWSSRGTISIIKDIQYDIRDKHVLIVEQIVDSGRTLKFFYDRIKEAEPASVEVVCLLDKNQKRVVDTPIKYIGRPVSDQFLVGYGLDLEEKCRNLADIYYLKYPN